MKLDFDFLVDVLKVMDGYFIPRLEAEVLAERLGSTEELFAWILFRKNFGERNKCIKNCIVETAQNNIIKGETRRKETNYPIEERNLLYRIDSGLLHQINLDREFIENNNDFSSELIRLKKFIGN
jgi:hypothetical protein